MFDEAKDGRDTVTPAPYCRKTLNWNTMEENSSPKVSVARAAYRFPMRVVSVPTIRPPTPASSPPTTTPRSTGRWYAEFTWAVASPPIPAQVIWHSDIMPPSPVTRVNEGELIAIATPSPTGPPQ